MSNNEVNFILHELISPGKEEYGCYKLLRELLENNSEFREFIIAGVKSGKVRCFDDDLWSVIDRGAILSLSFDEYFKRGINVGDCASAVSMLSSAFSDDCILCYGEDISHYRGTANSPRGNHNWIVFNNNVIDTSLMIEIDLDYARKMGYIADQEILSSRMRGGQHDLYCEYYNGPKIGSKGKK